MKVKRDKLGRFVKGQVPWNKNLKGWNAGEKNSMYGKGYLLKDHIVTKKTREKISKKNKGKHSSPETEFKKGHKVSKKTRRKIGEANKGHIATEKTRKKVSMKIKDLWKDEEYRKNYIEKRAKQVFPMKDSSQEVKIQNFLKSLGIEFFTHQYMKIPHAYQCDILIPPMNLIIECDGDFIHCNPAKYPPNFVRYPNSKCNQPAHVIWERDKIRTKELIKKGFKVLRLWEFEINEMSINAFQNKLRKI